MFSGIVEASTSIKKVVQSASGVVRLAVERPLHFESLLAGDSIANNGICLTLESFTDDEMSFCLGPETLQVTKWEPVVGERVNLERSLRFGDRVHGHLVSGHIDDVGFVSEVSDGPETRTLIIEMNRGMLPFVWRKGSVAVHGVSLTINNVEGHHFTVGLIPETLKRTNLGELKKGSRVNLEADAMARAWYHWRKP